MENQGLYALLGISMALNIAFFIFLIERTMTKRSLKKEAKERKEYIAESRNKQAYDMSQVAQTQIKQIYKYLNVEVIDIDTWEIRKIKRKVKNGRM